MTKAKLEDLKVLANRAFPPVPWWRTSAHGDGKCDIRAMHMVGGTVSIEIGRMQVGGLGYDNVDLIVALHNSMHELIAVAEALKTIKTELIHHSECTQSPCDCGIAALIGLAENALKPLTKDAGK